MAASIITPATLKFLKDLKKNNQRDWFAENKDRFEAAKSEMKSLQAVLKDELSHHDEIAQVKLYRIYRDVRFSKNKVPYKTSLSGYAERATKWKRGGYYFHIEPGNCFAGGGFWNPEKEDLARIRQEIASNDKPLRKIIKSKSFRDTFGTLDGNQLKTAPRGYEKDHPAVDLLRYKQFLVTHPFTDKEVLAPDFAKNLSKIYKKMRPLFDYMSEALTTDENGVPIE